jgi:hypothetical protein
MQTNTTRFSLKTVKAKTVKMKSTTGLQSQLLRRGNAVNSVMLLLKVPYTESAGNPSPVSTHATKQTPHNIIDHSRFLSVINFVFSQSFFYYLGQQLKCQTNPICTNS